MTTSRVLARNTVLNVAGQLVPMLAALVSIPILIAHLGASRFGVLTLAWAMIGYFSLFDLGLGRALTQAVAARTGMTEGSSELPQVVWTALGLMLALGVVGGVLLMVAAPQLVDRVLKVPADLRDESVSAFLLLGLSLPAVVCTAGFRGLLEAHQDFAAATALRIPLAISTFVAPLVVLPFSTRLGPLVAVLVVGRYVTWGAHVVICVPRYAYLRTRPRLSWSSVMPLLRLGGWMTASNIASPVMAYLDRFYIGAVLALAAVAHYVTPYEIVTRLQIFPTAMIAVMFPAFASSYASDPQRTAQLFDRSVRILVLTTFPLILAVVLFAREGLNVWVGPSFAAASTSVLQWLAVGVFANSLAQAPFAMLQGIGRPDLTAKLHLMELPLYVAGLAWVTHTHGIVGVAVAWTVRVTIDAVALFIFANGRIPGLAQRTNATMLIAASAIAVLSGACYVEGVVLKVAALTIVTVVFAFVAWLRILQPRERALVLGWRRGPAYPNPDGP
jgi:Membrane protein involved in the export of O-antigen and teichoic acid